jgi:hypothetical protein
MIDSEEEMSKTIRTLYGIPRLRYKCLEVVMPVKIKWNSEER